jgi:hypothetical protein
MPSTLKLHIHNEHSVEKNDKNYMSATTGRAGGLICPLKAVDVQSPKGDAA